MARTSEKLPCSFSFVFVLCGLYPNVKRRCSLTAIIRATHLIKGPMYFLSYFLFPFCAITNWSTSEDFDEACSCNFNFCPLVAKGVYIKRKNKKMRE